MAARSEARPRFETLGRLTEIVTGLVAAGISIVVLANPFVPIDTLIVLLAITVATDGVRLLVTGGTPRRWWQRLTSDLGSTFRWLRRLGRVGLGVLVLAIVIAVLVSPQIRELSLLYGLAIAVVLLSLDRLTHGFSAGTSRYLQVASAGAGAIAIALVLVALVDPSIGLATFAVLLAVSLLLDGVQSVVSGLRPTDPRQIVLLKLVLFALFYGLVLINWIDLFGKAVPAYGVWLILTYFAPFWVILIYEGFSEWPLAISLGLLVSLANDVGYYFVGNLLFGFHQDLVTWSSGQLGLYGDRVVTFFQAGAFTIPVDSWMMGVSIYARAVVVTLGLYYWWRHPSRIVARVSPLPPVGA